MAASVRCRVQLTPLRASTILARAAWIAAASAGSYIVRTHSWYGCGRGRRCVRESVDPVEADFAIEAAIVFPFRVDLDVQVQMHRHAEQ